MAFVERNNFPLSRRGRLSGAAVGHPIAAWPSLPEPVRGRIMAEARAAWDCEYHVPRLVDGLESIMKRHPGRS